MNDATSSEPVHDPGHSSSVQQRLLRFEAAWSAGIRPSIADYLAGVPADELAGLVRRLVRLDASHRWRRGDIPSVDDYRVCLSHLDGTTLAREIEAARSADPYAGLKPDDTDARVTRSLHGTTPEGPARQYVCCPQCHHAVAAPPSDDCEIVCKGCGTAFRVEDFDQAATRPLEPRTFGRFQLLEKAGSGSFGAVWKAFDTELRRTVAVKIPHARLLDSTTYRERFLREARAAAQLNHPGIVRLYDVPVIEDTPVLVSDLIAGVALRDLLQAGRPPFDVAASLAADMAEALGYAHARGLVHRDVKPGNVIVKPSDPTNPGPPDTTRTVRPGRWGKPVIVDFGLALRGEAEIVMTVEGQLLGTPAYMSPEQAAHAHRVDGRSDLYSLGVVLYEMLTGELPFRGSKAMIVHQVLHEDPRPPRRLNDRIPRDLETICLKAMAKKPEWRYETGAAMADDLRRFLRGEPILARPVGPVERAWRWCRRNPLVAGLWAAVALLFVAGTAVSSYFAVEASNRARQEAAARRQADESARQALASARQARVAEQAAKRQWYNAEMAVAARFWREQRAGLVLQTLDRLRPAADAPTDLRGFDWFCLARMCRPEIRTFAGHRGVVRAVAVAPSGRLAASGGDDGAVRVWDLALARAVGTFTGHQGSVRCVAFHPDGVRIVSGGEDQTVGIWNLKTGGQEKVLPAHPARIVGLGIGPDGRRLFVASGGSPQRGPASPGTVSFHDLKNGGQWAPPLQDTRSIDGLALSPDGRELALLIDTGRSTSTLRVWDCATRRTVREFPEQIGLRSVAFSPDGRRLAWGGNEQTVRVWNRDRDQVLTLMRHPGRNVNTVSFSPDGRRLASAGSDEPITVWDAERRGELLTLVGHVGWVNDLCFSPDGRRLVSAGADGAVKVWDSVAQQEPVAFGNSNGPVVALAFAPDSRLAYARNQSIFVRDLKSSKTIWSVDGPGSACGLAIRPDGRILAAGTPDGILTLRYMATGRVVRSWQAHDTVFRFALYSPDGKRLATGCEHTVKVWDPDLGKELLSLPECDGNALGAAFSTDGRLLAVADGIGAVLVWSFGEGRVVRRFTAHEGAVHDVAFHPTLPVIASAGRDGMVRVWDALSGEERMPPLSAGPGIPVRRVCFSPDGQRVATGDWDGVVKVWDAITGGQLLSLEGHLGPVFGLAFSPDGLSLASGSSDGTVRLWDGHPLTPDVLDQREARSLVHYLAGQNLPATENPLPDPTGSHHQRASPTTGPGAGARSGEAGEVRLGSPETPWAPAFRPLPAREPFGILGREQAAYQRKPHRVGRLLLVSNAFKQWKADWMSRCS